MPYVKKEDYEHLKNCRDGYYTNAEETHRLVKKVRLLEANIEIEKLNYEFVFKALGNQVWETERWKRYYQAAIKTFKINEYVEMPGCFNPMESIEYIAKRQEETKDEVNRHGC